MNGDPTAPSENVGSATQALTTISKLSDLRSMSVTGNYVLNADIDASETLTAGKEFVPIGDQWNNFTGTFDGAGHTINKLKISSSGSATGLFAYATNATIQRVGLTNVSVTGMHQTGALVGVAAGTSITSSYVTGTVSGLAGFGPWYGVGMMVGTAYSGTNLTRVYATGTVNGPVKQGGGLVGSAFGSTDAVIISEAFTNVNVNPTFVSGAGLTVSGGIVGETQGVDIQNAHSMGTVLGDYSGGIVGENIGDVDGVPNSIMRSVLTRCLVKVRGVAEPGYAGLIGNQIGGWGWCGGLWDSSIDAGQPRQPNCQVSEVSGGGPFSTSQLKNAHPSPFRVYVPYTYGELLPNGDGSDGHWNTAIWNFNSSNQLTTLRNIPNPSVQPL